MSLGKAGRYLALATFLPGYPVVVTQLAEVNDFHTPYPEKARKQGLLDERLTRVPCG